MIEVLAFIEAPHFACGIVLWDDKVIQTAPITAYMRGWSRDRVREYCKKKDWKISITYEMERSRPAYARRRPKPS